MKQVTVDEFVVECDALAASFCSDLTAPLDECTEILLEDNATNFRESMTPDGTKWAERISGGAWPILIKSGTLEAAATKRGAIGNVIRNNGQTLEMGVEKQPKGPGGLPGTFVHQHGYPERNIAARPYVGASDDAQDRCADVLGDFAQNQIFPA